MIATILGLPESSWPSIAAWSRDLGLGLTVDVAAELDRVEAALAGLYGYADELIADRGRELRDDFVSTLVEAHHGEDRLSADELRVALVLLMFGGMDTTRNQLGLALETFLRHPDQWELLAARPELGDQAVEEVMRVNPTITWVTREACEDFEFGGVEIAAGTTLHLLTESAGTDPRRFGEAPFDITVKRPRHFGFGAGVHHCIGHYVARTRHERGAAAARRAPAQPAPRRRAALASSVRQHRSGRAAPRIRSGLTPQRAQARARASSRHRTAAPTSPPRRPSGHQLGVPVGLRGWPYPHPARKTRSAFPEQMRSASSSP